MPQLVGITEIAAMLKVSRQRADQIAAKPGFPKPAAELSQGRVWMTDDVEAWIQASRSSPTPQDIVKSELTQIRPIGSKLAVGVFRSAYSAARQKGLGRNSEGIPDSREFALSTGLAEARKIDRRLDVALPMGWLGNTDMDPWSLFDVNQTKMAEVYRFRVRASTVLSDGIEATFTAPDGRQLVGTVVGFDESRAHVRVKRVDI